MKIPLWIKKLIWLPWATRCQRDDGWVINHRVILYLFGEMDTCSDSEVWSAYIAAARIVSSKMKDLA